MHCPVWRRWIPLALWLSLSWTSALAQDVTGSLQGRIVSAGGGAEPEVRVRVSGPHLMGVRETTTDRSGFFQCIALPPGRYTLKANRVGLRPLEVRDVVVELGRTTGLGDLFVEAKPVEMAPVVVARAPLALDPVHTTAGGTLHASDYAALPVERDYKALVRLLPHANDSYRGDAINVGGSTGLENQYYIDGVSVTDARTAERSTSLPYEFVREVDVKTGGYEAQYGRALGAVVNAITYSGTNDHEASVFGFTEPGGLTARPRTAPVVAERRATRYDYGARASGPVVRDRVWYSAAVNPRVDEVEKEIAGQGYFLDRTRSVRFAGKLTLRSGPLANMQLSVFGDPTVRDRVEGPGSGIVSAENPDPLLSRDESGGVTTSLRASLAPSSALLLQAHASLQQDRYSFEGATSRGRKQPVYVDYLEGVIAGGRGGEMRDERNRASLGARGTFTSPSHTIVAGADYEAALVDSRLRTHQILRTDSSSYMAIEQFYEGRVENLSPAAYLQDYWRVTDRVSVNLGMRWSGQFMLGASGRTAQRIDNEWQPRVGFVWQLGTAGSQQVLGSYGRFYQMLPTNMSVNWFVDWMQALSFYSTDPRLPGVTPDALLDLSTTEEDWAKQIPGLHAENFDEFTLGYERLVGAGTRLGIRGLRRRLRSSFQYGLDFSLPQVYVLGTPGQGDFDFLPAPKREYTALEVSAEGAWRGWSCWTSYVLSRSWGNYPGLYDSDASSNNAGSATLFSSPEHAVNSTGFLPNDRTHVFKVGLGHGGLSGLSSGALFRLESGAPVNELRGGQGFPAFLVQRGKAGRTPVLWNLDLRFAYETDRIRALRTRVTLDLLQVGSPRRATRVDELHYAGSDESGNPVFPNPLYGSPLSYQPPMAARLGVQFGF